MGATNNVSTKVKLTFASQIRLVDLVHDASERVARLAGFNEDEALNVGLAVREAVINAVMHGNGQDPDLEVGVTLEARDDGIRVVVTDQGPGFDPAQAPDPTAEDNLLATHGRGLLMIRAFVDDVEFRHREGQGMEIELVKRH